MPVTFKTCASELENASRFDRAVRELAPVINVLRENSANRSTRKVAEALIVMGKTGPKGKPLNPTTMRRLLQRMHELGLGDGVSSRSRAASDRRTPYHPRLKKKINLAALKAFESYN